MPNLATTSYTRDNSWLFGRLNFLWSVYFKDVPRLNLILIRFGRYSKLRLGSIKLDPASGKTYITITAMFKDLSVAEEVVDHTIAHELCHYAHGFSSPHQRLHRFPHEGGVIKKEMETRGLVHLFNAYRAWIKSYREELKEQYKRKVKIKRSIWRFGLY